MANPEIDLDELIEKNGKSLFTFPSDYTVIDLETTGLEPYNDHIIEIACVKYRGGKEVDRFDTLIQPPPYYFNFDNAPVYVPDFITELTGITNEMLINAPCFKSIGQKIYDFLDGEILVGHNVTFDIRFLKLNFRIDFYLPFYNDYVDTLRLSRRILPDLPHHTLTTMADHFNIEAPPHRAFSDCLTTQNLLQKLAEMVKVNNINLAEIERKKPCDLRTLKNDNSKEIPPNFFFGKTCVFTGKLEKFKKEEAAQIVVNMGGKCDNNVNKSTNILVVGGLDSVLIKEGKSNKLIKAEKMREKGKNVHILSEDTFYELIADFIN